MKVILNWPHTHEGVLHEIGAEIEMLQHDAERVVLAGIANFKAGVQKIEHAFANDDTEDAVSAIADAQDTIDSRSLTDDSGATHE